MRKQISTNSLFALCVSAFIVMLIVFSENALINAVTDILKFPVVQNQTRAATRDFDITQCPSFQEETKVEKSETITVKKDFFDYLTSNIRGSKYPGVEMYLQYITAHRGIKDSNKAQPLRSDFGMVINDVAGFEYTFNVNACRPAPVSKLSIFIAITSAPHNVEKRQTIRETWLRYCSMFSHKLEVVGIAFVLGLTDNLGTGEAIAGEHQTYGDILQVNMFDSYYNLSIKDTGLLSWLDKHCSTVDYVLRIDDDVYVNFNNLIRIIQLLEPSKPAIYGCYSDSVPHRGGTWEISFEDWPWSTYPGYLRGPSNLITQAAIRPLLEAAQTIPYHPFDDLFVSGLCAERAGVRVFTSEKFFVGEAESSPGPCYVRQSITWLTNSPDHMRGSDKSSTNFYNGSSRCDETFLDAQNKTLALDEYLLHSFNEIIRR